MKPKTLGEQIDDVMEIHRLKIAVFVYVRDDGTPGYISRSDSEIESAHLLIAAAEVLHGSDPIEQVH